MTNKRLNKKEVGINASIIIDEDQTKIQLSSIELNSKQELKKFISKLKKLEKFLK